MSSQAYTPGLERKESTIIIKHRDLPVPGTVLIDKGEKTGFNTIVARTFVPGDVEIVKVANDLQVDPEFNDITRYMKKKVGDKVSKDELIAEYKALFGLINYKSTSSTEGVIESVSNESGQVLIRGDDVPVEIESYIPGTCSIIRQDVGVDIACSGAYIQGIFGLGGEISGELFILVDNPSQILTDDIINETCKDKILIGGSIVTSKALRKAVEVGAKGIIVGGINAPDLNEFIGYDIGVAITGNEELGITLIVTEGFGHMNMAEATFEILKKYNGELTSINGATQIRAGVIRPEIIIPHEIEGIDISSSDIVEETGLEIGTKIRVIREPYFGHLGKVTELPVALAIVETESKVRVLEAELDDGRQVIVPRANVEIIKE